jgi:hypothetical protein
MGRFTVVLAVSLTVAFHPQLPKKRVGLTALCRLYHEHRSSTPEL